MPAGEALVVHDDLVARSKTAMREVINHLANPSQVLPSEHKELLELLRQVSFPESCSARGDAEDTMKALYAAVTYVDPHSGETLLSRAIEQKRVDAAYALVGAGSDVNGLRSTALGKVSPLVLAVAGLPATAPIIPLLIAAGADADAALPNAVAAFCALPAFVSIDVLDQALATVIGATSPAALSVAAKAAPLLEAAACSDAPDVFFALVARMRVFKPAAADTVAACIAEATADAVAAIAAAAVLDDEATASTVPASESKVSDDAGPDFFLPFAASAPVPGSAASAARWAAAAARHTVPRLRLQRKFAVAALTPALVAMARAANAPALVAASELYTGGCWAAVDAADADRHNAAGAVVEEVQGTSGAMIPGEMDSAAALMDALIGAPATPRRTAAALAFLTHGPLRAPLPSCSRRAGFIPPYIAAQRTGDAVATGNAQLVAAVASIACVRRRIDSDNDVVPLGFFPLHLAVRARDPALLHALLVPGAVLSGSPAAVAAALATLRTHLRAATSPAAHDASAAYFELLSSGQYALVTKLYRSLGTVDVLDGIPLLRAVEKDNVTGVHLLLALGADVRNGKALTASVAYGSYRAFKVLRAAGAPICIDATCVPFPEGEGENSPEISAERKATYAKAGVWRSTGLCQLFNWGAGLVQHYSSLEDDHVSQALPLRRLNASRAILDAILAEVPHPRDVLETLDADSAVTLAMAAGPFTPALARRYGPEFALRSCYAGGLVAGEYGAALGACLAMRSTRDALRALSPEQVTESPSVMSKDDADAIQRAIDDPLAHVASFTGFQCIDATARVRGLQAVLSRLPPPKNGKYTQIIAPHASAGELDTCLAERQHDIGSSDIDKIVRVLTPGCRPAAIRVLLKGAMLEIRAKCVAKTLTRWAESDPMDLALTTETLRPSPEPFEDETAPALILCTEHKLPLAPVRGVTEAFNVSFDAPELHTQLASWYPWMSGAARARMFLQRMTPAAREELRRRWAFCGPKSHFTGRALEAFYTALEQIEAEERGAPDHVMTVPREIAKDQSFHSMRYFGLSAVARYHMM
jgi:hypothetical protein